MRASWAIVIFASRENISVLCRTIEAAKIAAQDKAHIDILVNGNTALATDVASWLTALPTERFQPLTRVWSIDQAGKANAWNKYLKNIWTNETVAFFIDGYVRLNPDAIQLLGYAVEANPNVLGGTGVPSSGRSAKLLREKLIKEGGFHGNFCCMKGEVIHQIRERGISLPYGLYRVDSLMGALLSFGLHPEFGDWNHRRILVHPEASWKTDEKHWWSMSDLLAHIKRTMRQSRGFLENQAVIDHFVVRRQTAEVLPCTAANLVQDWASRCPEQLHGLLRTNPLIRRTLNEIVKSSGESADGLPPTLLGQRGSTT